ncbi:MAG: tRNA threonylcarbamoyladenosine dehydratase [Clostridia bacterium]|nr:tRNA threonylcarbamoyladenosine dehydratase [Clostridia bacterium]
MQFPKKAMGSNDNQFQRTQMLLGAEAMRALEESSVAIFGIGGVGSFASEALARSGVGKLSLFDYDRVCVTNINRQLIATTKTVGRPKVEVMRERIMEINPNAEVFAYECFYGKESEFDLSAYDYIVDAIDTVSSKLMLIENAKKAGVRIISSMGAGNKLDPTKFEVADIYETSICPLARVMRRELKKRGIDSLKVVYSKEPAKTADAFGETAGVVGSVAFVPSVAGLIMAGEAIKDLAGV